MAASPSRYLLEPGTVGAYLAARHLLGEEEVEVVRLGGGISNEVLLVRELTRAVVVKQALPRLRVAEAWPADPGRAVAEARALEVAGEIRPGEVPRLLALVPEDHLLVMEAAPEEWAPWKADLLAGRADASIARRLGELVAAVHAGTDGDPRTAERFGDPRGFLELRIDPYHRTVARRHPELEAPIGRCVEELLETRRCLVHGDLSPKNVLTGAGTSWLIDWEVAHLGNPVFDLAFLLSHLSLKAAHRPEEAAGYWQCASDFLGAYEQNAPGIFAGIDPAELVAQTACLLLARVDGKSPVEYLAPGARDACRRLASRLLRLERPSLEELFRPEVEPSGRGCR